MVKVSDLSGAALDYQVALAEDVVPYVFQGAVHREETDNGGVTYDYPAYSPSTDWALGGPLMQKHYVQLMWSGLDWYQPDMWHGEDTGRLIAGDTPLQAICRAVVRAAFGDEVEEVSP